MRIPSRTVALLGVLCSATLITWLTTIRIRKIPQPAQKYAFATFLGKNSFAGNEDEKDEYFMSARQLNYALSHSPTTNSRGLPFLVLCTKDVSITKRDRLEKEGAIVIVVEDVTSNWIHTSEARWADMLTKLRLFELIEYDRICYIDSDTYVASSLTGVFADQATFIQKTLSHVGSNKPDEVAPPHEYVLAAHVDYGWYKHDYPPSHNTTPNMNAGFFVLQPSKILFEHYLALLAVPNRFDPYFMEQSMLNHAHGQDGHMPWQPLWSGWNVNWPTIEDWKMGVKSFHDKFWEEGNKVQSVELRGMWLAQRREMEEFYRTND